MATIYRINLSARLSKSFVWHYVERCYAECRYYKWHYDECGGICCLRYLWDHSRM